MDIQKTSIQQSALGWVRKAIDDYLSEMRTNLNRYQDDYDDSLIEEIKRQLSLINGVLTMVEQFGAAMLTEEMVALCEYLIAEDIKKKDQPLEVLLRAVLQLPDYIERIQSGLTDLPLVILPLLNDIRAIQNKDLFSEKLLFLPKLSQPLDDSEIKISPQNVIKSRIYAKKIRPVYLFSLLSLIKEKEIDEQFDRLTKIAAVMEERSQSEDLKQFWIILAALVESLSRANLEVGVSIKMLLGKVDTVLKTLINLGEVAYIKNRPAELIKNLLYYVAQPECDGPKSVAVKTAYQLDQYLPSESERKKIMGVINGPNKALLRTVGESVKNDIETVKSSLEVYINGDLSDFSRLSKVPEELHIISDTLGMVGMGAQREIIESKRVLIQSILDGEHKANEDELLLIAKDLLLVEDGLDNINKIQHAQQNEEAVSQDFEFDSVLLAVVTATLDDFQKIKTSILDYLKDNSKAENLVLCVSLLNESKGAMDILGQPIVSDIMGQLSSYIKDNDANFLSENRLDIFSDVIISIEFFLEALGEKRSDIEMIAQLAETKLAALMDDVAHAVDVAPSDILSPSTGIGNNVSIVSPENTNSSSDVIVESISNGLDGIHEALEPLDALNDSSNPSGLYRLLQHLKVPHVTSDLTVLADGADPEILEIYIEEAEEESESIRNNFRLWKNDLENEALLTNIRRSFHTIKGSGRLVGALLIGEFAWDYEELLNRLIARTISINPDIVQCVAYAAEALPDFVEEIKSGATPTHDISFLRGAAQLLATYNAAETLLEREKEVQSRDVVSKSDSDEEGLLESANDGLVLLPEIEDLSSDLQEIKQDLEVDSFVSEEGLIESVEIEPESNFTLDSENEVVPEPELEFEPLINFESEPELNIEPVIEIEVVTEPELILDPIIDEIEPELTVEHEGISATPIQISGDVITEEGPPDPFVETSSVNEPVLMQEPAATSEKLDVSELVVQDNETEKSTLDPESLIAEPEPLIDSELFAIYQQEVQSHISQIFSFLDELIIDKLFDPTPIYRSLHTINGASKTARITTIGDFATVMDKPLRDFSDELKAVFDLDTHQLYMQGATQLSLMINELDGAIDEPVYSMELFEEFKKVHLVCQSDTQTINVIEKKPVVDDIKVQEPIVDEPDVELVEIFLEEANEILNDSDAALFKWKSEIIENKDSDSINTIMEIQRYLHTLKGGARMANFKDIADVSHEMESLFIDVLDSYVDINIELMDVLNECFDLLANMVEAAENKQPNPDFSSSLAAISRIRKGDVVADVKTDINEEEVVNHDVIDDAIPDNVQKSKEIIKVRSDLLDNLVNSAGEVSIYRSRMQEQVSSVNNNLGELDQTISRLKRQLRNLEAETDAQIRYSHKDSDQNDENYDPLEMDRYTKMQELSKSLAESVEDLSSLRSIMGEQLKGSETLLLQQSRINGDLQDGLIRSRMVKFSGLVSRLRRIVRQASGELAKKVELILIGEDNEIDNKVLDRMLSPLEHLLRNAIAHGIEAPVERVKKGKSETGIITLEIKREGADIVIVISDDGAGIDKEKIRRRALQLGLIEDLSQVQDQDLIQLILEPGFTTEEKVTQISGRGVGMDVVDTEIKQLGGSLNISTKPGEGSSFVAKLPFTLSVNQAILVDVGDESFAIPLNNVEGISRVSNHELAELYKQDSPRIQYADHQYELHYLAPLLDLKKQYKISEAEEKLPIILTRSGDTRIALHVDNIVGNREIVVKTLGKQLSQVKSLSGASILGDGRIVLILDVSGLVAHGINRNVDISQIDEDNSADTVDENPTVMVVDDSITMRRVAQKLLGRNNFEVITAKDGIDALSQLGDVVPDVMLLDIEMPRMDGFELATHMKKDQDLNKIPIIMVTSRTGEKHRNHAKDIGVERYMGKPYQEAELLENINQLLEAI